MSLFIPRYECASQRGEKRGGWDFWLPSRGDEDDIEGLVILWSADGFIYC